MDGTKTLRDYLLSDLESDRLEAASYLLSIIESSARSLDLMTSAVKAKHNDIDLLYDLEALRQQASALQGFCFNHLVWLTVENKPQDAEQSIAELPAVSELRH